MENKPDSGADEQPLPMDEEFVTAEVADSNSSPDNPEQLTPENGVVEDADSVPAVLPIGNVQQAKAAEFLSPGFSQTIPGDSGTFETRFQQVTPLDPDGPEESLRRETAVAGAVTAVFLGVWSIVFSFFTGLAVINAMLGIAFAVWGLFSTRSTMAVVGLLLCCVGFVMTMVFVAR